VVNSNCRLTLDHAAGPVDLLEAAVGIGGLGGKGKRRGAVRQQDNGVNDRSRHCPVGNTVGPAFDAPEVVLVENGKRKEVPGVREQTEKLR